ncbi:MAG: hypothetical protein R2784_14630 [Saprospiraceae bacterium]
MDWPQDLQIAKTLSRSIRSLDGQFINIVGLYVVLACQIKSITLQFFNRLFLRNGV